MKWSLVPGGKSAVVMAGQSDPSGNRTHISYGPFRFVTQANFDWFADHAAILSARPVLTIVLVEPSSSEAEVTINWGISCRYRMLWPSGDGAG
jgi:hypothetical protein